MLKKHIITKLAALSLGLIAAGNPAHAGTATPSKEVVAVVEEDVKPAFSGWLSFDLNSHFISYGADVWGAGTSWGRGVFNPSFELSWATPLKGLSLVVGTWWDVNNNAPSNIGGMIQEVDIWTGGTYAYKDLSATVLYQAWNYASTTEQILDVILKYSNNTFLNPAITIHNRLDAGGSAPATPDSIGGHVGTFFVPNLSYNWKVWEVTVTPSAAMGFCTNDFHGGTGGYAYTALGVAGSIPISFLPGSWELHGGLTYYSTSASAIPNNVADNFVTGNVGVKLSF
ncbi:MAG: hypothetical protein WCG66_02295 [bacterium]